MNKMIDKEFDKLISTAIDKDQDLPEGLSSRLDSMIENLEREEQVNSQSKKSRIVRHLFIWTSSIAACLLISILLLKPQEPRFNDPIQYASLIEDTYSNPKDAAIATEKALAILSEKFNLGIETVNNSKKKIEKVNKDVNNYLNKIK
ncbi:MAG: hypothetical protein N4A32_06515 [Marinifilaceae bacterium]|nr:hypothetical protein [Marinifilaceae bacterium]